MFDLAIVGLGLLAALLLRRSSALVGVIYSARCSCSTWGWRTCSSCSAVWLNMVYPLMALVATYTMLTVYRYVLEERERRRIKQAFQYTWRPTSSTSCSRTRAASASAAARRC